MNYYNPFPQPPSATGDPCLLDKALTLLYAHSQGNSWKSIVAAYFLHHDAFLDEARSIQGQVYNDAQGVIGQLNSAIDTAASGLATVVDTSDFTGHDMCAQAGQWVFSPTLTIDLSFPGFTFHGSLGGLACPDPAASNALSFKKSANFSGGNLNITVSANCVPHPTPEGQAAIANDFYQQG